MPTCNICKQELNVADSYGTQYCSEFCAGTSDAEKLASLNLQEGSVGNCFPCVGCGCVLDGEYVFDARCTPCQKEHTLQVELAHLREMKVELDRARASLFDLKSCLLGIYPGLEEIHLTNVHKYTNVEDLRQVENYLTEVRELKSFKLWLDDDARKPDMEDFRYPPLEDTSWVVVTSVQEAKDLCTKYGAPDQMSLDHDLGMEDGKCYTAMDFLRWLEGKLEDGTPIPKWTVHSRNPVGAENIKAFMASWEKSRTL